MRTEARATLRAYHIKYGLDVARPTIGPSRGPGRPPVSPEHRSAGCRSTSRARRIARPGAGRVRGSSGWRGAACAADGGAHRVGNGHSLAPRSALMTDIAVTDRRRPWSRSSQQATRRTPLTTLPWRTGRVQTEGRPASPCRGQCPRLSSEIDRGYHRLSNVCLPGDDRSEPAVLRGGEH